MNTLCIICIPWNTIRYLGTHSEITEKFVRHRKQGNSNSVYFQINPANIIKGENKTRKQNGCAAGWRFWNQEWEIQLSAVLVDASQHWIISNEEITKILVCTQGIFFSILINVETICKTILPLWNCWSSHTHTDLHWMVFANQLWSFFTHFLHDLTTKLINYHACTSTPLCMQPPVTAYSTPGIHTLTVWPDAIRFYFKMSNLFLFTMYTCIVATRQIWPQVRSCQNRATSVSEWNVYQQSVRFTIWKPPSLWVATVPDCMHLAIPQ